MGFLLSSNLVLVQIVGTHLSLLCFVVIMFLVFQYFIMWEDTLQCQRHKHLRGFAVSKLRNYWPLVQENKLFVNRKV